MRPRPSLSLPLNVTRKLTRPVALCRKPSAYYADLYRENELRGGHVIKLGPGNDEAARSALKAWPSGSSRVLFASMHSVSLTLPICATSDGLQVGGGINESNAQEWLDAGAEKVRSLELPSSAGCP